MSNHDSVVTYSNWDRGANGVLTWLGAESSRNDTTGQPLRRRPNESSYVYFSRWLQSYGATLAWETYVFPQAILWRPTVNGLDLPACGVAIGENYLDEYRAKEDACEALIAIYRCVRQKTLKVA